MQCMYVCMYLFFDQSEAYTNLINILYNNVMNNTTTDDQGYYYIRPKVLNIGSNNLGLSFYKELMFNTCLSFNSYKIYIFQIFITVL